jgi:hypothetical protein
MTREYYFEERKKGIYACWLTTILKGKLTKKNACFERRHTHFIQTDIGTE